MTTPKTTSTPETTPASLAITLFGPMHVTVEGRPLPRMRLRKTLSLLALLALRHGRPVERTWLAATLWPDADEEQALGSLRKVLSELRQALGNQAARILLLGRPALCLEAAGVEVDATAFDAAVKSNRPADWEQAVALYRGPLLEGSTEEWVGPEREARERDCLRALGALADAAVASGEYAATIGYYRRSLGLDPWGESARRGLMEALAKTGDANEALSVYRALIELLRSDPKAVPDQATTALYTRLRDEARRGPAKSDGRTQPSADAAPVVTGYLPHPITDLIGREDERVEVKFRLRRSRLVTLTGPGGIGKTRLAIAVASEATPDYADGVCLVPLESLSDGAQVAGRIAGALGLTEQADRPALKTIADHLRGRRLLLVLDNCEQVLAACAQVAGHLLHECGDLRVLATSREALGIMGETVWPVPPLAVPDPMHLPRGQATLMRVVMGYESVQLFAERAESVQKAFSLGRGNALAVAEVCYRLEGIPLAIELAAARVRALSVEQIAARLDDYLGLLTGGSRAAASRQQTLRAALDWSYDLLNPRERLLLERLSAFAGGWDLAAAEQVCAGEGIAAEQVLDLMTALLDKSLVACEASAADGSDAAGRYRLLETVRQYARERLDAGGTAEETRTRHRDCFLERVEAAAAHLTGPEQTSWLSRLEADHDNFRAALSWQEARAETGSEILPDAEAWLRVCAPLSLFWAMRGHYTEGRLRLERALHRTQGLPPSPHRARVFRMAGCLAANQGDSSSARGLFEESLGVYRQLEDARGIAAALTNLGNVAYEQGDYAPARALFGEALGLLRQLGEQGMIALTLGNLGLVAFDQGDNASARALLEESLELKRRLGNQSSVAITLGNLGQVVLEQGDLAAGRALYEESLGLCRQIGYRRGIAVSLSNLGNLAHDEGDQESARALLEESLILFRHMGDPSLSTDSLEGLAAVASVEGDGARGGRIWGAVEALREKISRPLTPRERQRQERHVACARALSGTAAVAAAWDEGRVLSWGEAIACALGEG